MDLEPSDPGTTKLAPDDCTCTAARTERAARAAVTTAFDRLPVVTDEEF